MRKTSWKTPRPFVLLVHPDERCLLAARRGLRDAGLRVGVATSGKEALKYLRDGGPADLVVVGPSRWERPFPLQVVNRVRPELLVILVPKWLSPRDREPLDSILVETIATFS